MASLTKRTLILVFSQTITYAVQFLSPIFLVRLLDQTAYGQYREFIVYSTVALSFINFGIKANLLYFVSVDPENIRRYVSNTVFLLFAFSLIGIAVIFSIRGYILGLTTYDFIGLLIVYIFAYQNIDLLDSLFLAKKRSDLVLYWSTGNIVARTLFLILVAYWTQDVVKIIYLLILLEVAKTGITLTYLLKNRLLGLRVDWALVKAQLFYLVPLGFGALITQLNTNVSNVIVSANLGAAALAIYSIGSHNIPLLNIVRQSLNSVIFPEMAQRTRTDPMLALRLWNQSNVMYMFLLAPCFFILWVYADVVIGTLFTEDYLAAVPLFRIYLILLLRRCFEMGAPLRAMNKNTYFAIGNLLSFVINVVMIYLLFELLGFYGPAVAFVAAEVVLVIFLGAKILTAYGITLRSMLDWKKIGLILGVNAATAPILLLRNLIGIPPLAAAVVFSGLFLAAYLLILRRFNIYEVDLFMSKMLKRFNVRWTRRKIALPLKDQG